MPSVLLKSPPLQPRHEIFHVDRILVPESDVPKRNHKIIAVMPAYNAETTLAATLADIPVGSIDEVLAGRLPGLGERRGRWTGRAGERDQRQDQPRADRSRRVEHLVAPRRR